MSTSVNRIPSRQTEPPEYNHHPLCEDGRWYECDWLSNDVARHVHYFSARNNWCHDHNVPARRIYDECMCDQINRGEWGL